MSPMVAMGNETIPGLPEVTLGKVELQRQAHMGIDGPPDQPEPEDSAWAVAAAEPLWVINRSRTRC